MTSQEKQNLAEKIALLLSENESESSDAKFFRESLEKINQRLEKIESQIHSTNSALSTQHSALIHSSESGTLLKHRADRR